LELKGAIQLITFRIEDSEMRVAIHRRRGVGMVFIPPIFPLVSDSGKETPHRIKRVITSFHANRVSTSYTPARSKAGSRERYNSADMNIVLLKCLGLAPYLHPP
jgi:hypothetical protein